MPNAEIAVEVIYALPGEQTLVRLNVTLGTTALQAIELSGLLAKYSEIDLHSSPIGIFGKAIQPDRVLRDRDRIEIYRPLAEDPKDARRARQTGLKR
ncbi:MAG TPA: RnfH family protein [Burkholderiales bacterium]|jgi:putative ubiquitin-RnfH superfamily antitoxin RatB of RatAB toxin-antitoxin module|nr:RnfH family protein [Burkholderiales bacterium]